MSTINSFSPTELPRSGAMSGDPAPEPLKRFVDSKDGNFIIFGPDGQPVQADLGTIMMMVNMKRTENLDKQVASQLDAIQKRNAIISAMTEGIAKARQAMLEGGRDRTQDWWEAFGFGLTMDKSEAEEGLYLKLCDMPPLYLTLSIDWGVGDQSKYYIEDPMTGKKICLREFAKNYNVPWVNADSADSKDRKAAWETNISSLKSRTDVLNTDSQMDNITLQNILEKRNNSFEMCTKVMQTNNSSVQSVLRNL